MKKTLILSALAVTTVLSSCKKDEDKAVVPSVLTVLASDSTVDEFSETNVNTYFYNSNKKVVKVAKKYNGSSQGYDSVYYNAEGKVSKVENRYVFDGTVYVNRTSELIYSNGNLSMLINTSSPARKASNSDTTRYTYVNGKLFKIEGGDGVIDSISFVSNNIASAVFNGMKIIVTTDLTAPNPYINSLYSPDDFLSFVNANNVLKAYPQLNPLEKFEDNTYTYLNGKVASKTDYSSSPRTTYFKYKDL